MSDEEPKGLTLQKCSRCREGGIWWDDERPVICNECRKEEAMKKREVEWVELSGGTRVPSHLLVCPQCNKLDLGTTVDTSVTPMVASCSRGHEWPLVVN